MSWLKQTKKWLAEMCIDGKFKYLGSFSNFEDAANARKAAELEYFGRLCINNKGE